MKTIHERNRKRKGKITQKAITCHGKACKTGRDAPIERKEINQEDDANEVNQRKKTQEKSMLLGQKRWSRKRWIGCIFISFLKRRTEKERAGIVTHRQTKSTNLKGFHSWRVMKSTKPKKMWKKQNPQRRMRRPFQTPSSAPTQRHLLLQHQLTHNVFAWKTELIHIWISGDRGRVRKRNPIHRVP